MRCFSLALLLPVLAFGPIISPTYSKVGEQFVLGGQQRGASRVKVRNSGPVPVSVAERRADGAVAERGRLELGQRAVLALGAGSAVVVRNLGDRLAKLDAEISGDTSSGLGMRCEALKK